jgi:hypothetical protein
VVLLLSVPLLTKKIAEYHTLIDAKITAMTVTEPFPAHLVSVTPNELQYTPIEYMKHAEAYAGTVLGTVLDADNSAGVNCEVLHVEHGRIYQAIIDERAAATWGSGGLHYERLSESVSDALTHVVSRIAP